MKDTIDNIPDVIKVVLASSITRNTQSDKQMIMSVCINTKYISFQVYDHEIIQYNGTNESKAMKVYNKLS